MNKMGIKSIAGKPTLLLWLLVIGTSFTFTLLADEQSDALKQVIAKQRDRIFELEKKNKELQGKIDEISKSKLGELNNPLSIAAVADWKIVQALQGSSVYAKNNERTFLGTLDFTGKDLDSIFNQVGLHGSPVGLESIWNDVGFYGSEVGLYSARNSVCINPPVIVKNKQVVAQLTVNPVAVGPPGFNPYHLQLLAKRIQGKQ